MTLWIPLKTTGELDCDGNIIYYKYVYVYILYYIIKMNFEIQKQSFQFPTPSPAIISSCLAVKKYGLIYISMNYLKRTGG